MTRLLQVHGENRSVLGCMKHSPSSSAHFNDSILGGRYASYRGLVQLSKDPNMLGASSPRSCHAFFLVQYHCETLCIAGLHLT